MLGPIAALPQWLDGCTAAALEECFVTLVPFCGLTTAAAFMSAHEGRTAVVPRHVRIHHGIHVPIRYDICVHVRAPLRAGSAAQSSGLCSHVCVV